MNLFISRKNTFLHSRPVVAACSFQQIRTPSATQRLYTSRYCRIVPSVWLQEPHRLPCLGTRARGGEKEKRGKHFEESHHIIQNTFRRLYTCVTWHTWPPNHSDTHLSGTTAPTRWILLLSSGHFEVSTRYTRSYCSSQAGGTAYKAATTFFLSFFLPSFSPPTTVRKAELPSLCVGLEPADTHRRFHGCCITEQSVATKR